MAVMIKGMEMPKSCMACDLFVNDEYCPVLKYKPRNDQILTASCCPLVEIPTSHGRLIDADEFEKENEYFWDLDFINPMYSDTLSDLVNAAPTIIEAEE